MKIRTSELLGWAVGWMLAPVAAVGSALRGARVLHASGVVYKARVEARPGAVGGALGAAASRLEGDALVRLSSALWRGGAELPDVLGFAVRIHGPHEPIAQASPGDQDILFATIRRPSALILGPLMTNPHSFMLNDYYGVSPFDVEGIGRVRLRVVSPRAAARAVRAAPGGRSVRRDEELRRAVEAGTATFTLEMKRRAPGSVWEPIVAIRLIEPADVDQEALRFSPFQEDRGVVPRGFIHALRHGVYWASQRARPARGRRR